MKRFKFISLIINPNTIVIWKEVNIIVIFLLNFKSPLVFGSPKVRDYREHVTNV